MRNENVTRAAGKVGALARLTKLAASDSNLRRSLRALLYHLGRIDEASPRQFFADLLEWAKGFSSIQRHYAVKADESTSFSDALLDMYPRLADEAVKVIDGFEQRPTVTLLLPVYAGNRATLEPTLKSIARQLYANLELVLLQDRGVSTGVSDLVAEICGDDQRVTIRQIDAAENGLAAAFTLAAGQCQGTFVGFVSEGDRLARSAVLEVVRKLNECPEAQVIYTDSERSCGDYFSQPFRKPGWSIDLFRSLNYIQDFLCVRTDAVRAAGTLRGRFEADIKYDLLLRVIEKAIGVHHVPEILYYEQTPKPCFPVDYNFKSSSECHKEALSAHMARSGTDAEIVDGLYPGSFRVRRAILNEPAVSIIIPTRDRLELLRRCIDSIEAKTSYRKYEIVIIDNSSTEPQTLEYLRSLSHKVVASPGPFNFSKLNNLGAQITSGEHLLFLNNDTEVITADWIGAMLEHSQRPEVGAVGAKLLYPNGLVQHAGMGLHPRLISEHLYKFQDAANHGDHGLADVVRNLNIVTGACLMMRRSVFEEVGGFRESLAITYNDLDLCLKARAKGYLVVYTPYALLYHYEGISKDALEEVEIETTHRGKRTSFAVPIPEGQAEEVSLFYDRWKQFIESDIYYTEKELPSSAQLAAFD